MDTGWYLIIIGRLIVEFILVDGLLKFLPHLLFDLVNKVLQQGHRVFHLFSERVLNEVSDCWLLDRLILLDVVNDDVLRELVERVVDGGFVEDIFDGGFGWALQSLNNLVN